MAGGKMKMLAILIAGMLATSIPIFAENKNNPPEKPTISGPTEGETGKSYTYTAVSTDPDGDKIFYCFDWGDGNEFCSDMVNSGTSVSASHTWESDGTYTITVVATDEHGAKSEPATLKVKMPYLLPKEELRIIKPRNGIYLFGIKVMPIIGQIVIGNIKVKVIGSENIKQVEFLLPLTCGCGLERVHVDISPPFEWTWDMDFGDDVKDSGLTAIYVRGYDADMNLYKDSVTIYRVKI